MDADGAIRAGEDAMRRAIIGADGGGGYPARPPPPAIGGGAERGDMAGAGIAHARSVPARVLE